MGVMQFLKECEMKVRNYSTIATDSTAGNAMASRIGVGKAAKHIHLGLLCMRDLVAHGIVRLKKVDTKDNLADLNTMYLPATNCDILMSSMNCVYRQHVTRFSLSLRRVIMRKWQLIINTRRA